MSRIIQDPNNEGILSNYKHASITAASPTLSKFEPIILCNTVSNIITLNLSQIAIAGNRVIVKVIEDSNKVILSGVIDGITNPELRKLYDFVELFYDGSSWHCLNFYSSEVLEYNSGVLSAKATTNNTWLNASGDVAKVRALKGKWNIEYSNSIYVRHNTAGINTYLGLCSTLATSTDSETDSETTGEHRFVRLTDSGIYNFYSHFGSFLTSPQITTYQDYFVNIKYNCNNNLHYLKYSGLKLRAIRTGL